MSQLETPTLRQRLKDDALDTICRAAQTYNGWLDKRFRRDSFRHLRPGEVGTDERQLNATRFLLLRAKAAKERLRPALAPGNIHKTMAARVTMILCANTSCSPPV